MSPFTFHTSHFLIVIHERNRLNIQANNEMQIGKMLTQSGTAENCLKQSNIRVCEVRHEYSHQIFIRVGITWVAGHATFR